MPEAFFPPLPDVEDFNSDQLRQWLQGQTVSFQKIITGTLQASQVLESSNFVSGSAGWQIDGDGNAEFNDVSVRGDIVSGNWNGADPANLTSADATATAGFYLDSSVGSAQFEGSLFVGGDIELTSSGEIRSSTGTTYIALRGAATDQITFVEAGNEEGYIQQTSTGLRMDNENKVFLHGGHVTNGAEIFLSDGLIEFKDAVSSTVVEMDATQTSIHNFFNLNHAGELTIASGAITATGSYHTVDTQSDASSDDLDTINGGGDGDVLVLKQANSGRNVVIKHNTGNIICQGAVDYTLDFATSDMVLLVHNGTNWVMVGAQ